MNTRNELKAIWCCVCSKFAEKNAKNLAAIIPILIFKKLFARGLVYLGKDWMGSISNIC